MLAKIGNELEYKLAMKTIDSFLNKATTAGGFHHLTTEEKTMQGDLSKLAETYEDNSLKLMPVNPGSSEGQVV
jgi:HTH-type transcriptional regulator / antitoxin HigA